MTLKERIARLMCRHEWVKVAMFQEVDQARNERYSLRRYECRLCGKISHQDSRRDRLADRAVNG